VSEVMSDEELGRFVAKLIATQRAIDGQAKKMADEIVDGQRLETLDEAKRFASNWIQTAAQYARNEEYWQSRAHAAERKLVEMI
jgi:polyhydroxyalkanoate synthesis regulator phasin